MRTSLRWLLILVTLSVALAACQRRDRPPTATPTPLAVPTATSAPDTTGQPPDSAESPYDWPPQVVYTSPAPGEETLLDGAITVRFDQPMDQASVEAALSVTGADAAGTPDGVVTWPRPDTLIFTPQETYARAAAYRVQIAEAAQSLAGRPLEQPVVLEFATVGYLEVAQTAPADGAEAVQTDTAITVFFNRPVVPLAASGDQSRLPQPLTFDPPLPGRGQWVSTSIYRFVPDAPLAGASTYRATVAAGLADITGGVLAEDVSWSFQTVGPRVIDVGFGRTPDAISPTQPISVTFNMPMDRAATEAAIALNPPAPVTFNWNADSRTVAVIPDGRLPLATLFELAVSARARAATGAAQLVEPFSTRFSTVPFPAVAYVWPGNDPDNPFFAYQSIQINFVAPMNPATIDGQIIIEPAPLEESDYYVSPDGQYVSIQVRLARNTTYQVTIPGTVADPYGNTLSEPYIWSFTTPDYEPIASLNVPPQVSQISTSFPSAVDIIVRNVDGASLSLYAMPAEVPVQMLYEPYRVQEFGPGAAPRGATLLRTWPLESPPASSTAAAATVELASGQSLAPGFYFLALNTADPDSEIRYWQNRQHLLIVADTNLVVHENYEGIAVWATDLASGTPRSGLALTFYNRGGRVIGTAQTDADGLARLDREELEYLQGTLVVAGTPGASGFGVGKSDWYASASPWELGVPYGYGPESAEFFYLYTERPIYRPGDTVYFRGIVRQPEYGRYASADIGSVELVLRYGYGDDVTRLRADVDARGNFSGEYTIAADAQLGSYTLSIEGDGWNEDRARTFTVAQYRKPEFVVTATADQTELLRGDGVDVTIAAEYLFGAPAPDLELYYTVYEDSYRLPWEGPYYSFEDESLPFFFRDGLFGPGGGFYGNFVTDGQGRLDADGRFTVRLPADLLNAVADGSRTVTVEATVRDVNDFSLSARTQIVYHAADTYVGVRPQSYINSAGRAAAVDLITVDWATDPVAQQAVTVVFFEREWISERVEQFGTYLTEWKPFDTEVARTTATSGSDGRATASFTPERGGSYVARATVTDGNGRRHTSSTYLYVSDSDFVGWRFDARDRRMDLVADQRSYAVGDSAEILVQSPFAGPIQAWLTVERGDILQQEVVTLASSSEVLRIPIEDTFAPNVFVSLVAVKPVDNSDRPWPDIRLGVIELPVARDRLLLNLTLEPDAAAYMPGDDATFTVRATDYSGRPVQADVSLALVDLAVLLLKDDNAPDIADAFYGDQPFRSQIGAGLFISAEGLPVELPVAPAGLGGGGGDVAAEEAAVLRDADDGADGADDVREDFRDTAYWEAVVTTDADGRATVTVPLPDNLTTWRLTAKGVSAETLVGQTTTDIVVTKPVLLRPVTPRFFTVGDIVELGVVVNNNTPDALSAIVTLETDDLLLDTPADQTVTLPARRGTLVRWTVRVPDVTAADLVFRVAAGPYTDASRPTLATGPDGTIPVTRYNGRDITGTSGVLDAAGQRVEAVLLPAAVDPTLGAVQWQFNASLAASVLEALEAFSDEPYALECAHAHAERLLANAATAGALRSLDVDQPAVLERLDLLIPTQIQRLVTQQTTDGGWTWCFSRKVDPYLSAEALLSLTWAAEAGYDVPANTLSRAVRYLRGQVALPKTVGDRPEVNRQAFFLYVLSQAGEDVSADADQLIRDHRNALDPYATGLLLLAYANSGEIGRAGVTNLLADLNGSVIVSAAGAHWEDAENDWFNLNSDIRGTAMILTALVRQDPANPLLPNVVRWLMVGRSAQTWPTGPETAWSIAALSRWMVATGELDADYDYALLVNNDQVTSGRFGRTNILQTDALAVPVGSLSTGDVNFFAVQRGAGAGRLYYTAYLDAFISADQLPATNRGIIVQRAYYDAACDPDAETCAPLDSVATGQTVRVELTIIAPNDLLYAVIEDPLPAGAEAIDPGLNTSPSSATAGGAAVDYRRGYWGWWAFNRIEFRDTSVVFSADFLPAGTYQYTYNLQPVIPGTYQVMPTFARQEFFPDVFGRAAGQLLRITE